MNQDHYTTAIEGGNIANCAPDWEWRNRPGNSNIINLWFIYKGQGLLTSDGETYKLSRGDCFLLRHSQSQYGRHDPADCLVVPYILFVFQDDNGECLDIDDIFPEVHYQVEDPNLMYSIMKRCLDYYSRGKLREANHWLKTALLELRVSDMQNIANPLFRKQNAGAVGVTKYGGYHFRILPLLKLDAKLNVRRSRRE